MQTLYLRTVGRRSGTTRRTPLYYVEDGDNLAIVTSNAGRDHEPAWWLNLQAEPNAEVDIRKETRPVHARRSTRTEDDRLWPQFVSGLRNYAAYKRKTDREIVVVILEPR
ncbi:MAG TPA: nitroreductase/quinone reductase family protein [Candidatus Limnocylindrales bacterium]|nr:nitroreductase/quinone reductase family protein [Candidatus Limnocylindrales bacterium]